MRITPLMTGILFDDPPRTFLSFVQGEPGYQVELDDPHVASILVDEQDRLTRMALRIVAPLLLGAQPELLSQPGAAMATWVVLMRVEEPRVPHHSIWAASFERGSLEGIKFLRSTWQAASTSPMSLHNLLRDMAEDPLLWFSGAPAAPEADKSPPPTKGS